MPVEWTASFDYRATAAVLRSGSSLEFAGHVAAVISVLSMGNGGSPATWIECSSMLIWCVVVYLAVRVKMDALFFELLAVDQSAVDQSAQLDGWLDAAGLRQKSGLRTFEVRRRGALRLWKALVAAVAAQITLMLAGMLAGRFRPLP